MTTVSICICTYQRPKMLACLLEAIGGLRVTAGVRFNVVVVDNDATQSAASTVAALKPLVPYPLAYCVEPEKNIALARNRAVSAADGEYIAFIDDDEVPEGDWLLQHLEACTRFGGAGTLGPVRPRFDGEPPAWLLRGRFCERPEPPTGTLMEWTKCRTGNVLLRSATLPPSRSPFRPQFGTGGEDKDFFMQMSQQGHRFYWCNEAVVYETVPPNRWTRRFLLSRALLRGRNVLRHPEGRVRLVLVSLLAVPIYCLALPFALAAGQHVFMQLAVRLCDHLGRLLALVHLNPVSERPM